MHPIKPCHILYNQTVKACGKFLATTNKLYGCMGLIVFFFACKVYIYFIIIAIRKGKQNEFFSKNCYIIWYYYVWRFQNQYIIARLYCIINMLEGILPHNALFISLKCKYLHLQPIKYYNVRHDQGMSFVFVFDRLIYHLLRLL